ncbi:response regulator [Sulfurimonas sp. SAG-AH-194-I05]|nr:ATP-binding protein [Sulfurimonas sp. SAG-AH-194-I05]MDF1875330.1 response regulator [Sulfurimonas sp. SAG-AH-194-I05]
MYEEIFDNSSDGMIIIRDNKVIACNKVILKMFKYEDKKSVLQKDFSQLSPAYQPNGKKSYEDANEKMKIAFDNGIHTFEWMYLCANNNPFLVTVVLTDISTLASKKLLVTWKNNNLKKDKTLLISNIKSEFLANVSHEIRTPLNAILGFIEILQEDETNKTKQKYLEVISSSSKNLLNTINDILDFSKIENGKLAIENRNFDPMAEMKDTKRLFKPRVKEKNVRLFTDHRKLPKILNGDILRIKQVINNLLSNAIKFTPSGKNIYLDINYEDGNLKVNVKDEGIGISQKNHLKVFEAFSQAENSTTRKYGGTGIGLTIAYNLVKAMGGEMKLISELGVGSEFYFSIPMKEGVKVSNDSQITPNINFENKKMLLVEDNSANQIFMKVILKKLHIAFDIANDGVESLELFKANKYDCILMDENMPNMNGIIATKRILEIEKEKNAPHTPIIALTANALKGDRERFLAAGMDEYLTKPISKNTLGIILSKLLK